MRGSSPQSPASAILKEETMQICCVCEENMESDEAICDTCKSLCHVKGMVTSDPGNVYHVELTPCRFSPIISQFNRLEIQIQTNQIYNTTRVIQVKYYQYSLHPCWTHLMEYK